METAKQTVREIAAKAGHHDTTVHEQVAPAVKHETVKPTRHEEVNTAVDQEVHQDHYHRTVQPVRDTEVLPEQHKHRVAGVERREFDHRDQQGTERALKAEAGKLHNERVVADTTQTKSHAPAVQGEHFHHHVHETVQPLIQKEVIQPEVVHTTVPVHEVHHHAASHHATTHLPAVSMHEFKQRGGGLGGAGEREGSYEGCPSQMGTHGKGENVGVSSESGVRASGGEQGRGVRNVAGSGRASEAEGRGVGNANTSSMLDVGGPNTASRAEGHGVGHQNTVSRNDQGRGVGNTSSHTTSSVESRGVGNAHTGKKPSLMDKLNPFKDADGDGKSGIMD